MTLSEIASGAASTMGRYFNLVSLIPSVVLVLYIYLLVASGAWSRPPDPEAAYRSLTDSGAATIGLIVISALATALAAHPLQFPLIQLYEGYWGTSRWARKLWLMRATRHMRLARHNLRNLTHLSGVTMATEEPRNALWASGWITEFERTAGSYPESREEFNILPYMPTRLGNVLRRYELLAGAPFNISSVHAVPYLALVAEDRDVAYLDDQRATLDLAVRLSATSLFACGLTMLFLWDDGLWLLLALLPYALGYIFYRGSVVVAHEYGRAMATLIALNRTALYRRLRLRLPSDAEEERERNRVALGPLLELNPDTIATYFDPPDSEETAEPHQSNNHD